MIDASELPALIQSGLTYRDHDGVLWRWDSGQWFQSEGEKHD